MSMTKFAAVSSEFPIITHTHTGWIKTVIKTQAPMKMKIRDRKTDLKIIEKKTLKINSNGIGYRKKMIMGFFLSDYIRKVETPGTALCFVCNDTIKFGNSGKKNNFICMQKVSSMVKIRISSSLNGWIRYTYILGTSNSSEGIKPTYFKFIKKTAFCALISVRN